MSPQLAARRRSITQRAASIDVPAVLEAHHAARARVAALAAAAAALLEESLVARRAAVALENDRFTQLLTHVRRINERLAAVYRRVVPRADCYLEHASNPISLFQEGVKLKAQHGAGAWRDAAQVPLSRPPIWSLSRPPIWSLSSHPIWSLSSHPIWLLSK